jgi:hypothetical protein
LFLKSVAAVCALDEMGMERVSLRGVQLAMEIGGEKLVNLFVDGCHKKIR